ncbi:MAG: RagB/SusD family nutrient uptake outer membrane protein [Ginsengibacter sp.]
MKKYFYIVGIPMLMLISCKKSFLELAPLDSANVQNFYNNANDVRVAVNAVYGSLQTPGQYGDVYVQVAEVRSDNTMNDDFGGNLAAAELDQFRMTTSNGFMSSVWNDTYSGIASCNIALARIPDVTMDETLKNRYIGELKFLRALMYFNLVRTFGDVPLVLNEVKSVQEGYEHNRVKKEDAYAQIITDLSEAEPNLPDSYADEDIGRATKGAAKSLLGKVYLTIKNYSAAAIKLKEVIDGGKYQLLPDYASLWLTSNENSVESIFEVQYKKGGTSTGSGFYSLFLPYNSGSIIAEIGFANGRNLPTQDLIDAYEPGDLRKDISISPGYVDNGNFVNEPYTLKFRDQAFEPFDADNNWPVLRYADVLLMYAEALNDVNNGPTTDAYEMIDAVRHRAGLNPLATGLSYNAFALALEHERQVELAFEGHRWFDLVRTGRALDVINAHFNGSIVVQDYQLVYPIPQSEVELNPDGVKQNPGYHF